MLLWASQVMMLLSSFSMLPSATFCSTIPCQRSPLLPSMILQCMTTYCSGVVITCLERLDMFDKEFPGDLRYSCLYWAHYLKQARVAIQVGEPHSTTTR
ncbi:hypothetical protein BJX99DRAFT_231409 [Aspergillus californicus]